MTLHPLPAGVRDDRCIRIGEPQQVEPLGGMSGARPLRVRGRGGTVIVKAVTGAVEPFVYRTLAPVLRGQGIDLPELFWASDEDGRW